MFAKEGGRLSRAWEILGPGGKQPSLRGASVDPPGQAHGRISPKDQHHSPHPKLKGLAASFSNCGGPSAAAGVPLEAQTRASASDPQRRLVLATAMQLDGTLASPSWPCWEAGKGCPPPSGAFSGQLVHMGVGWNLVSGSPRQLDTVAPRDRAAMGIQYQREIRPHPGFYLEQGSCSLENNSSKVPGAHPSVISGLPGLPVDPLALGGQPQIPRLPAPIYLSRPPPEVNCFARSLHFPPLPLWSRHVASSKVENQTWKITERYISRLRS